MKRRVFISWSGEESKSMAEALRDWLPYVLQNIEPWTSSGDIQAGARWGVEISKSLEECSCGIICLNSENAYKPWILFESGALGKSLRNTFVCPYLLDIDVAELPTPLSQFQGARADKHGTYQLVRAINDSLGEYGIDKRRLEDVFRKWWPKLKKRLAKLRSRARQRTNEQLELIEDELPRTEKLIRDLKRLERLDDDQLSQETVRYSGFLSAYAISESEELSSDEDRDSHSEEAYRKALLEEKLYLLRLARRGCRVRCVISPPTKDEIVPERIDHALARSTELSEFLECQDKAHCNIEWAISPFRQKNLYIVGRISCFEGFKRDVGPGYFLTVRQTRPEAVESNITLYDRLFEYLETHTLHADRPEVAEYDHRQALRQAVVRRVHESVEACRDLKEARENN